MKPIVRPCSFLVIIVFTCLVAKTQDISVVLPNKIERKYKDIKDMQFAQSIKSKKLNKFSELNLPENTVVYAYKIDSGDLYDPVKNPKVNATIIPCCYMDHFYEGVPVLVPYRICFKYPDPPYEVSPSNNSNTYKTVKMKVITVKEDVNKVRLHCFDGAIVGYAKVKCTVCPGRSISCTASVTVLGTEYTFGVSEPSNQYKTHSASNPRLCGNCPPENCYPSEIKDKKQ